MEPKRSNESNFSSPFLHKKAIQFRSGVVLNFGEQIIIMHTDGKIYDFVRVELCQLL